MASSFKYAFGGQNYHKVYTFKADLRQMQRPNLVIFTSLATEHVFSVGQLIKQDRRWYFLLAILYKPAKKNANLLMAFQDFVCGFDTLPRAAVYVYAFKYRQSCLADKSMLKQAFLTYGLDLLVYLYGLDNHILNHVLQPTTAIP